MIKTNKKYNEVLELLKYIPLKDYLKIPDSELNYLKTHQDPNYSFKYYIDKPISNQNISKEALIVFTKLHLLYIANPKEKETIKSILALNDSKNELAKSKKYNHTNIFKKSNTCISELTTNNLLIPNTKRSFIKKLLFSIKNIYTGIIKKNNMKD